MSDKDFYKLFELVIDELQERAETSEIEKFHLSEEEDEWVDLFTKEETDTRKYKGYTRSLNYNSGTIYTEVTFCSIDGKMMMNIGGNRIEIDVGWGAEYPELKKKFMRLYRGVEYFETVELAKRNLDSFYNSVQDHYPGAIDKLILGEQDDEEDGDSGGVPS